MGKAWHSADDSLYFLRTSQVSDVDVGTPAAICGLQAGDCILEVNGLDILGMRVSEISKIVKSKKENVTLLLWNSGCDTDCENNSICCTPMPTSLNRLNIVVQSVLSIIECPVCIETITPPAMQCQNGHLLCLSCRIRAEKCPICRDCYTPKRALIAEQIYMAIANAFQLCRFENKLRQKLFGGSSTTATKIAALQRSVTSTKPCAGHTLRQQKPSVPTNKFIAKLLQGRTYSHENLTQSHGAILLRTNSTDDLSLEHKQLSIEAAEISQHLTSAQKRQPVTAKLPKDVTQPNDNNSHFSFSTNDVHQTTTELKHAAESGSTPANLPPHINNGDGDFFKSPSLLFVGKKRPVGFKTSWPNYRPTISALNDTNTEASCTNSTAAPAVLDPNLQT